MQIDQHKNDQRFANSVCGIAERVAFQLGDLTLDDEYATFDKAWLTARVVDSLKWLQGRKPELFAATKTFTLEPGVRHCRPEGCDQLFEISAVIDDKGRQVPVCEAKYKDLVTSLRTEKDLPDCMVDFCIYHYAFNPHNQNEFLFSPTVIEPLQVEAQCSDVQSYLDDPDKLIDCEAAKYINMIVAYVMAQAAAVDAENPALFQISEQQLGIFRDLAPMRKRDDDSNRQT